VVNTGLSAVTTFVCLALVTACSEQDTAAPAQEPGKTKAALSPSVQQATAPPAASPIPSDPHAGIPMPGAGQQVRATNEGRVLKTMNAGGYTYIQVEHRGQQVWIASSRVDVARGQLVRWGDAAVMSNFHSKALGQTFEQILFVSKVISDKAATAPTSGPSGKVVSVAAGGGYSYIEVATDTGTKWLAAPMQAVSAGDVVSWNGGATMRNFNSKALARTFDEIVFVSAVRVSN